MAYSEKVVDHYENPRNVGSFDKGDDVGRHRHGRRAGLRRRDEAADQGQPATGLIEDAKFKTYGCGSAIASSSLVTEWVKGKTLDEALTIKNTQIAEELALPPVKIHCSILAEDAIKAAVSDYKAKHGAAARARREAVALTWPSPSPKPPRATSRATSPSAARAWACAWACKTTGCSGLAYKLEYADDVAPEDLRVRRAMASRCSSTRRACRTSTAPSSTSCAKA